MELRRDVSLSILETSVDTLLKLFPQGNEGLFLSINGERRMIEGDKESTHAELVPLLREFEDLFMEPHSLPPKRD